MQFLNTQPISGVSPISSSPLVRFVWPEQNSFGPKQYHGDVTAGRLETDETADLLHTSLVNLCMRLARYRKFAKPTTDL